MWIVMGAVKLSYTPLYGGLLYRFSRVLFARIGQMLRLSILAELEMSRLRST
jgi:hypothetical protein